MNATTSSSLLGKIETIQGAYQIEYLMEDVRVTFKHDVKVSIDGVTIDAKEGEISSLRRWVAKI